MVKVVLKREENWWDGLGRQAASAGNRVDGPKGKLVHCSNPDFRICFINVGVEVELMVIP